MLELKTCVLPGTQHEWMWALNYADLSIRNFPPPIIPGQILIEQSMCVCEAQPDSRRDLPLLCLIANGGFKLPFVPKPRFITELPALWNLSFFVCLLSELRSVGIFLCLIWLLALLPSEMAQGCFVQGHFSGRVLFWKGFVLHKFAGITRVISAPLCAARPLRAILWLHVCLAPQLSASTEHGKMSFRREISSLNFHISKSYRIFFFFFEVTRDQFP